MKIKTIWILKLFAIQFSYKLPLIRLNCWFFIWIKIRFLGFSLTIYTYFIYILELDVGIWMCVCVDGCACVHVESTGENDCVYACMIWLLNYLFYFLLLWFAIAIILGMENGLYVRRVWRGKMIIWVFWTNYGKPMSVRALCAPLRHSRCLLFYCFSTKQLPWLVDLTRSRI